MVKITAVTCLCTWIFHTARTTVVKVYFVLGNEAHCLLDAAGASTFAKDSSILTGHDCVSILPCSVVLTGRRYCLDVVGCWDWVALMELGVHIKISTRLEATLQGKDSESEHSSCTGVHRADTYSITFHVVF